MIRNYDNTVFPFHLGIECIGHILCRCLQPLSDPVVCLKLVFGHGRCHQEALNLPGIDSGNGRISLDDTVQVLSIEVKYQHHQIRQLVGGDAGNIGKTGP